MARLREHPRRSAVIALALIVLASTLLRILLNRDATGPWIFIDEMIYSELGRSAWAGAGIRGVPISGYGNVYPLLISPAYLLFENLVDAYTAVKAINALVMSATAVPVYLIARTLMGRRWSLVAALLSVAIPAMTYTSVVMTESAFYPAFALTTWFAIMALNRGSLHWQVLVFAGTLLCFETRPQGAVVAPVFAVSIILLALLDAHAAAPGVRLRALGATLRRFWVTWFVLLGGLVAVVVMQRSRGQSLSDLLGAYAIVAEDGSRYQPRAIATWYLQHLAELDLWLGVIPFAALLLLIGRAVCASAPPPLRAFAAFAVPMVLLMALVVSAFAVFANVGRIEERNLFYVGFFALIALCWWISAGAPTKPRWFALVLVISASLPVALPYGALINQSAVSDTFGLFLPWAIQNRLMEPTLTPFVVLIGGLVATGVLLVLRAERAWLLAVVVVTFFVVSGVAVDKRTDKASQGARQQGISGPRDWIDRAVPAGTEVAVLYPGANEPLKVWENEFFNRSVGPVFPIGVPLPGGLPEMVMLVTAGGDVVDLEGNPLVAPYVLVDTALSLEGAVIAEDVGRGMAVMRTSGPLRATQSISGVMGDDWSGAEFGFVRYRCTGGTVEVVLESDAQLHPAPITVAPMVGDQQLDPVTVPPGGSVTAITALTPIDGSCTVRYLVSPTAVPAEVFGAPDTRALGVLVRDITYRP